MKNNSCTSKVSHSKIKTVDKGSPNCVHYLVNKDNNDVHIVHVDNCYIKTSGKKCDFLLFSPPVKRAFFIELKGCDLKQAIKQLLATVEALKDETDIANFELNARAVLSKFNAPKIKVSPEYVKLVKLLGSPTRFVYKCRNLTEKL